MPPLRRMNPHSGRMTFWNPDGAAITIPDEWCLTDERGWMRVDDVAALIRIVAESSDIDAKAYEQVFQLSLTDGVAEQYSVGDISEDDTKAMIASIEGFFIRQ